MTSTPDWRMEVVTGTGCLFAIMMGGTLLVNDPTVWHLAPLFIGGLGVVLHADTMDKIPELGYSILGFYGVLLVLTLGVVFDAVIGSVVFDIFTVNNTIVISGLTIVLLINYALSVTLEFPERILLPTDSDG